MTTQKATPSPIHVQKYLAGLDYPVEKQEILDKAKEEGADRDTLKALEEIPDREYASPIEVSKAVSRHH